jgi:hypothetical protein
MALNLTIPEIEREIRTQRMIYLHAEPGCPESNEASRRVRQMLAVLRDQYSDENYIRLVAEWQEIQREKQIEVARQKHRKNRCSVMAHGGITRYRFGNMK